MGKKVSDLNELYALWLSLAQTRHLGYRLRQKELEPFGITPRQATVLHVIQLLGNRATPAEIARWVGREGHTISSNLNTMEKHGLIRKQKDLDKKNLIRVALTKKGQEARKRAMKRKAIKQLFSSLSKAERKQLKSIIEKIQVAAVKELDLKQKPPYQNISKLITG